MLGYSVAPVDSSCNLTVQEWMKAVSHLLCIAGASSSIIDSKQLQAIRGIYFAVVSSSRASPPTDNLAATAETRVSLPPASTGNTAIEDDPLF